MTKTPPNPLITAPYKQKNLIYVPASKSGLFPRYEGRLMGVFEYENCAIVSSEVGKSPRKFPRMVEWMFFGLLRGANALGGFHSIASSGINLHYRCQRKHSVSSSSLLPRIYETTSFLIIQLSNCNFLTTSHLDEMYQMT